jgi:hypothetical protein
MTTEKIVWKVDWYRLLMNILQIFLLYGVLPTMIYLLILNPLYNINTNTYFAVFFVFATIRIFINIISPPKIGHRVGIKPAPIGKVHNGKETRK